MANNRDSNKIRDFDDDLSWLDPDQELEEYEDGPLSAELKPMTLRESISRGLRSFLAITLCVVIPVLWYFDWNFSAFADETSEVVTSLFSEGDEVAVAPPLVEGPESPEAVGNGEASFDISMTDYVSELDQRGLLDKISSPGVTSMYNANVRIEYLSELDNAGLLEDLSFPAVISFYQKGVTIDYLNRLKERGMLTKLSFPAVVSFYDSRVTLDYLQRLNEAQLLDGFSFPAVIAFYRNDVTVEFLQDLEAKGLISKLSFPDIVSMYENR